MAKNERIINYVPDKTPPHDIKAERAILGAILMGATSDDINIVSKTITEKSFYHEQNGVIYNAMLSLHDTFSKIDIITIAHELKIRGHLDSIGGEVYLAELTNDVLNSRHIIAHARVVQEDYISREVINLCYNILTLAFSKTVTVDVLIDRFEKEIKALEEKARASLPNEKSELVQNVIDKIINIKAIGYNPELLTTDCKAIDRSIDLIPNEIIFLGGAAKSAKTKTLIFIMDALFKKYADKLFVHWNCMEDPIDKIIRNMISMNTGIEDEVLEGKKGHLTDEDITKINNVKKSLDYDFIEYNDVPTHIDTICRDFKSLVKKEKVNILIIDNFNICTDKCYDIRNNNDRDIYVASKIQHINAYLKSNGYKVIIIVLDHLKKEQQEKLNVESGYRPRTDHLKGSERKNSTLTQLVLINRPGKYPDLVAEEIDQPDIEINGRLHKRKELIEGIIILERTSSRNSADQGDEVVNRLFANISNMQFKDLNNI